MYCITSSHWISNVYTIQFYNYSLAKESLIYFTKFIIHTFILVMFACLTLYFIGCMILYFLLISIQNLLSICSVVLLASSETCTSPRYFLRSQFSDMFLSKLCVHCSSQVQGIERFYIECRK